MTRQRLWAKKQRAEGRCPVCGLPKTGKVFCTQHQEDSRTMSRNRKRFALGIPLSRPVRKWKRKPKPLPPAITAASILPTLNP